MSSTRTRASASAKHARTPRMRQIFFVSYSCAPNCVGKTKVQHKVQLWGETVSAVHKDVKPIGIGEEIDV